MEKSRVSRLKEWNDNANDLPRKGLVIAVVLLSVFALLKVFPYIAPFVVALVLSVLIEPLVRLLSERGTRLRLPRSLATLLSMVLVFGVLSLLITMMTGRALVELKELAKALPSQAANWLMSLNKWLDEGFIWIADNADFLSQDAVSLLRDKVQEFGQGLMSSATQLANVIARGAITTAISVPQIVLFIVLSILGTYYMVSDKQRISAYFRQLLPDGMRNLLTQMKQGMLRAVLGQMRAQVFLTIMMFCELLLGFTALRVPYALLLAFVIALLDAMPVVGSGLFLLPWAAFGFIRGDMYVGVGMLLLYGVTIVMRQLIEPRVVGAQLGLYPLATMMSMYAGFILFGFFGMLAGPMAFMLCRVAVYAVCGTPEGFQQIDPPIKTILRPKRKKK